MASRYSCKLLTQSKTYYLLFSSYRRSICTTQLQKTSSRSAFTPTCVGLDGMPADSYRAMAELYGAINKCSVRAPGNCSPDHFRLVLDHIDGHSLSSQVHSLQDLKRCPIYLVKLATINLKIRRSLVTIDSILDEAEEVKIACAPIFDRGSLKLVTLDDFIGFLLVHGLSLASAENFRTVYKSARHPSTIVSKIVCLAIVLVRCLHISPQEIADNYTFLTKLSLDMLLTGDIAVLESLRLGSLWQVLAFYGISLHRRAKLPYLTASELASMLKVSLPELNKSVSGELMQLLLKKNDKATMQTTFTYLLSKGYNTSTIARVPLILAYTKQEIESALRGGSKYFNTSYKDATDKVIKLSLLFLLLEKKHNMAMLSLPPARPQKPKPAERDSDGDDAQLSTSSESIDDDCTDDSDDSEL